MSTQLNVGGYGYYWTAVGIVSAYLRFYPKSSVEDINRVLGTKTDTDGNNVSLLEHVSDSSSSLTDQYGHNEFVVINGETYRITSEYRSDEGFNLLAEKAKLYSINTKVVKGASLTGENGFYWIEAETKGSGFIKWFVLALVIAAAIPVLILKFYDSAVVDDLTAKTEIDDTEITQVIDNNVPEEPSQTFDDPLSQKMFGENNDSDTDKTTSDDTDNDSQEEVEETESTVANNDNSQSEKKDKNPNIPSPVECVVLFDARSWELSDVFMDELNEIAQTLEKQPKTKVLVVGHSSKDGPEEFNEWIARRRAKSVCDYLIDIGVDKKRIVQKGESSTKAVEGSSDESRRVVVSYIR